FVCRDHALEPAHQDRPLLGETERVGPTVPFGGAALSEPAPFELIEQYDEIGPLDPEHRSNFALLQAGIALKDDQHRELRWANTHPGKGAKEVLKTDHSRPPQRVTNEKGQFAQIDVCARARIGLAPPGLSFCLSAQLAGHVLTSSSSRVRRPR